MATLARASALQFGANVLQTVFGAAATIYFVRVLGAQGFGQYALALAITSWVSIPGVGLRSGTEKRLSEASDSDGYYTSGLLLQALYALPVVLLVLLLGEQVDTYIRFSGASLVAGLFIARLFVFQYLSTLRGEGRVELTSIFETGWKLATTFAQVFLVFTGAGVPGLIYGEIAASSLAIGSAVLLTNERIQYPTFGELREIYEFGRYGWLSNFKNMSYSWMDTFVLGFFVSDSVIGAYEVAWRISGLFTVLPWAIVSVAFQAISRQASLQQTKEVERLSERALSFAGILAIPGVVGAVFLGPEILSIYGQSVVEVAIAPILLVILSFARIGESYEMIVTTVLNGLDRPDITFRIGGIFVLLNSSLNVLLILPLGAVGAALATTISIIVSLILTFLGLSEEMDLHFPLYPTAIQAVSAILMGCLIWILLTIHPAHSLVTLLLYVFVGVCVYSLALFGLSKIVREQVRRTLKEFAEST